MPKKVDMTGKTFHQLKVIEEAGRDAYGQIIWKCECSCKNIVYVRGKDLRNGNTKSCGCLDLQKSKERIEKQTIDHSNINFIKSTKISIANTTGVRGVCPTKSGYYRAYIGHKGKNIYLGEYKDISDAIAARKAAEEKYHKPLLEAYDKSTEMPCKSD